MLVAEVRRATLAFMVCTVFFLSLLPSAAAASFGTDARAGGGVGVVQWRAYNVRDEPHYDQRCEITGPVLVFFEPLSGNHAHLAVQVVPGWCTTPISEAGPYLGRVGPDLIPPDVVCDYVATLVTCDWSRIADPPSELNIIEELASNGLPLQQGHIELTSGGRLSGHVGESTRQSFVYENWTADIEAQVVLKQANKVASLASTANPGIVCRDYYQWVKSCPGLVGDAVVEFATLAAILQAVDDAEPTAQHVAQKVYCPIFETIESQTSMGCDSPNPIWPL